MAAWATTLFCTDRGDDVPAPREIEHGIRNTILIRLVVGRSSRRCVLVLLLQHRVGKVRVLLEMLRRNMNDEIKSPGLGEQTLTNSRVKHLGSFGSLSTRTSSR